MSKTTEVPGGSLIDAPPRTRNLVAVNDFGFPSLSEGSHLITPSGRRVTVAAGIRLSAQKVYEVDTLEGKLASLVNPDVECDITNRSSRSRAAGSCREIL